MEIIIYNDIYIYGKSTQVVFVRCPRDWRENQATTRTNMSMSTEMRK